MNSCQENCIVLKTFGSENGYEKSTDIQNSDMSTGFIPGVKDSTKLVIKKITIQKFLYCSHNI